MCWENHIEVVLIRMNKPGTGDYIFWLAVKWHGCTNSGFVVRVQKTRFLMHVLLNLQNLRFMLIQSHLQPGKMMLQVR